MAKNDRAAAGETAPNRVVYYSPEGREYPVNDNTLSAVERTMLLARGYTTDKPAEAASDRAGEGTVSNGGPLSGAVTE